MTKGLSAKQAREGQFLFGSDFLHDHVGQIIDEPTVAILAKLILDNPELSLKELRSKHGLSYWAVDRARRLFKLRRKRGAGSSAYKKLTITSSI